MTAADAVPDKSRPVLLKDQRMSPQEARAKNGLWQKTQGLRLRLFWTAIGAALASLAWIYCYDPALLGLRPTVPNPLPAPKPKPGTLVVDPLSRTWDFDQQNVPWAPILPLAQISESAYKQGPELDAMLRGWGLTSVEGFPVDSMYAYVASNDKVVVVAFRGTNADELEDWLADASILSDPVQHGRIHHGFYSRTKGMLRPLVDAVKDQGGDRKLVWVTGHSLGGAMALVFTYECVLSGDIKPVGLVTFGQPLVVNGELARFLNSELKGRYLRFVHSGDIVPRVFPTFSHCGNLVWFIHESYEFRRPVMKAMSAQKNQSDSGIDYGDDLRPLTKAEFEDLQQKLKGRKTRQGPLRKLRKQREITAAEAPAFLSDHYMSGYLHWVVKLSGQNNVSAAASGKAAK
jgi:triacylglycerol lipase